MRDRSHLRHWLFGLYVLVCLAAQTWPVYGAFGNSIEPYVLGLPWSLAWVVGWVILTFVALAIYHVTGERDAGGGS
jgi:amino acid transporter